MVDINLICTEMSMLQAGALYFWPPVRVSISTPKFKWLVRPADPEALWPRTWSRSSKASRKN